MSMILPQESCPTMETAENKAHFALCGVPDERLFSGAASVTAAASLKEACGLSPCIIGPIPLCRNGSFLNQTAFPDPIPIDLLFSGLQPGQALFGGCIFPGQQTVLQEKGVRAFDLMEDLTFSYYNTIATAEGAICEAIRQSPYPKTYDPSYEKLLGERLKEVISDPAAFVKSLPSMTATKYCICQNERDSIKCTKDVFQ